MFNGIPISNNCFCAFVADVVLIFVSVL